METINTQYEDIEELRSILGFNELNEFGNQQILRDLLLSGDFIENTWNLISKIQNKSFSLENIKSNVEVFSTKSIETGKKNTRVEKLFDNFSEFLNEEDCKYLQFSITEKSPSTLLETIYPNLENNSNNTTPNFSIDFSRLYSNELKNNFANVNKDNRNQKYPNENRNKDFKRDGNRNENDRNQYNSQFRNTNVKKKNQNSNYTDKNNNNDEWNNKSNINNMNLNKNEYNARKISDVNENKEKNIKSDKIKNNQENIINNIIESKSNNETIQKGETPKYVNKTVDEMFDDNFKYEVEQIEVIQVRREGKNYNAGRKKTDQNYQGQNYESHNYQNYDNRSDIYYGDNYNDFTDYSNGNFYNNKRNHNNGYNGHNAGNNGYNGKNKRYQKNKY